jgi:DNA polymerase
MWGEAVMASQFIEFQNQVEAVKARHISGEISEAERDATLRKIQLKDERWGDVWLLNAQGDWFRKASGSSSWVHDYPLDLIDPATLPPLPHMDLRQLARAVHDCTRCPLHQSRTRAVPGEGPPNAEIMLIGEGPGFYEDKQGRPFVGASGKFLEELLGSIGYKREDVFITNVVKCRPPNNRDPQSEELAACKGYLDRQIELINPKVIVTLGRYSMSHFLPGASITKIHGQSHRLGNRLIVPMFHPAAALHQPKYHPLLVEDFQKLPNFIKEAVAFTQSKPDVDPSSATQLNLF